MAHEFSHALAAWLLKYRVYEIRLGTGPLLKQFWWGECEYWIYALPLGGWCAALPPSQPARWKKILFVAAGPACDLLFLVLIWNVTLPATLALGFSLSDAHETRILYILLLGLLFFNSASTGESSLYGVRVKPDLYHLGQLFFKKHITIEFSPSSAIGWKCMRLWSRGKKWEAARYYLSIKKRNSLPDDSTFLSEMSGLFSEAGLIRRARETCLRIVNRKELGTVAHLNALDNLACLSIYHNHKELLSEGKQWIEIALQFYPDKITLQGTLGSILAEMHEDEKAEPLLRNVLEKSEGDLDQSICSIYLAWLRAQAGDQKAARSLMTKATRNKPLHRLVQRKLTETEKLLETQTLM